MQLILSNGLTVRGDLIKSATWRSDMAPIPVTLEADIRTDESLDGLLDEGQTITLRNGDVLRIIKSVRVAERASQSYHEIAARRITALLDNVHTLAHVRRRAIIKERATLHNIYRAAGAAIKSVQADFPVPRFTCIIGQTPTFAVARILQEEGGCVFWRDGKLHFSRLQDLFTQEPAIILPDTGSEHMDSGFEERHHIAWWYSLNADAAMVYGNRNKPRSARFTPFTNVQRLNNLTRCLVHRKTVRLSLNPALGAGDLVEFSGGLKLAVVTAAHCVQTGTDDGAPTDTFTRLWLASMEE